MTATASQNIILDERLLYPWHVICTGSSWYDLSWEIRSAMWDNAKRDHFELSGHPDNTNTWWLACQAAVSRNIEGLDERLVDCVLDGGYSDLNTKRMLEHATRIDKYMGRRLQRIFKRGDEAFGGAHRWLHDLLFRDGRYPSCHFSNREGIVFQLQTAVPEIWEWYAESVEAHVEWLRDKNEADYQKQGESDLVLANIQYANEYAEKHQRFVAFMRNRDIWTANLTRWIAYYDRSKMKSDHDKESLAFCKLMLANIEEHTEITDQVTCEMYS